MLMTVQKVLHGEVQKLMQEVVYEVMQRRAPNAIQSRH
jgi:hypothetical protein